MTGREDRGARCFALADLGLMLAEMLEPPSRWSVGGREIGRGDLRALAARSAIGDEPDGVAVLERAVLEWAAVAPDAAAAEYRRLFDGAQACPPNETAYVRRDKGVILADIAGFYRAFGFELAEDYGEKHDHVVAELQFAAMLLVLIGRAAGEGEDERREIAHAALVSFLEDHLGAWLDPFAVALDAGAALSYHAAVAELCRRFRRTLADGFGVGDPQPLAEPRRDPGTPYECGMCMESEPEN